MVGLFHGKSQSKMDDDWGEAYDSGNHHMGHRISYGINMGLRWDNMC